MLQPLNQTAFGFVYSSHLTAAFPTTTAHISFIKSYNSTKHALRRQAFTNKSDNSKSARSDGLMDAPYSYKAARAYARTGSTAQQLLVTAFQVLCNT